MKPDQQLPAPPRLPPSKSRATFRTRLAKLPWHLDKLRQIEGAIEKVLGQKTFNAAGLAALMARAVDARDAVDALIAERPDELAGMSPEQLVEWAGLALEGWPDQVLEVAFRVYSLRHRGRILFVGDSGHKSEYDPVEGWSRG
jgi:hypothetical protein